MCACALLNLNTPRTHPHLSSIEEEHCLCWNMLKRGAIIQQLKEKTGGRPLKAVVVKPFRGSFIISDHLLFSKKRLLTASVLNFFFLVQSVLICRQYQVEQVYWPNNKNKKLLSAKIVQLLCWMDTHRCALCCQPQTRGNMDDGGGLTEPTGPVALIYSCQEEGLFLITLATASFP